MGLLDDAIREHLELKRRHGADPDEVSRQEREALGAPVRGEFAKPAGEDRADADDDAPDAPEGPAATAEASARDDIAPAPDVPEADFLDDREPEPEPGPPGPPPEPAAEEPQPGTEEDPWLVEDLADEEIESEAAKRSGEGAEGEDVLEETPEFLQETPEHDRLWFEQKPPRDFDWDK
jgi:hypothetical protein